MNIIKKDNVEQISLQIVLNNAFSTLLNSIRSATAVQVLWLSFKNEFTLAKQYATAKEKTHLFDGRRKLSKSDESFKDALISATEEALEYAKWIREKNFQPIFQESLVTYCAAFENFLKTVAVIFRLANENKSGLNRQIFIPGPDLRKARADVEKVWQKTSFDQDASRAQFFYQEEIYKKNPDAKQFIFSEYPSETWRDIDATFKLRNAILHSMGRPHEQIILNDSIFHPGWEIELKNSNLDVIIDAIRQISSPFFGVEIPIDENEDVVINCSAEDLLKLSKLR